MSHARNVKTSPGKAEGTKCVEVYPRTDSDSSSRTSLFLLLQETRYLLINKIFDRIFGSINSPVIYIFSIFLCKKFQLEKNLVESKSTVEN